MWWVILLIYPSSSLFVCRNLFLHCFETSKLTHAKCSLHALLEPFKSLNTVPESLLLQNQGTSKSAGYIQASYVAVQSWLLI